MRTANSFRICTPMSALSRNLSLPSWPCLQDPPTCSHRLTKNRKRIYDCELEKEAFSEIRRPGSMDASHGLVRFSGDFEGSAYEAMQKVLATLYSNEEAMKQIKYPKATRFGCSGKLLRHKHTGMRRMEWTCIYDQKPSDGENLDGGKACKSNEDCTYYPGSTCAWVCAIHGSNVADITPRTASRAFLVCLPE
ncbi:hypothetical protein Y032_0222g2617 [Ancylostoma ceylanicum]|uniref:SCP domain-containing protein n=1 Tax=Ancylostoma ceylanicum TaxID=53326 RepID=A0A016SHY3_9BILA|nr:hypothetical protein Y032_0222g2617 [Ancylostoma ceylanicum]